MPKRSPRRRNRDCMQSFERVKHGCFSVGRAGPPLGPSLCEAIRAVTCQSEYNIVTTFLLRERANSHVYIDIPTSYRYLHRRVAIGEEGDSDEDRICLAL